jgi:uncharacterized protein YigE (DUF2233 family)
MMACGWCAMRNRAVIIVLALGAMLAPSAVLAHCERINHSSVCTFDPAHSHIQVHLNNESGKPYGTLGNFIKDQKNKGIEPVFAMNAGMYGKDNQPVGLYIENGKLLKSVNTLSGYGNFHLKPNGIFYIQGNTAAVQATSRFLALKPKVDFATQSEPMLIINGAVHPRFSPQSHSRKVRNGVGVKANGQVVFAVSEHAVTFFEFATFFRDTLQCPNALYLDGTISSLYAPEINRADSFFPLGPIVSVRR